MSESVLTSVWASVMVFSDMDGTLLDHHSYDYSAAQAALDRLAALNIPLILNTSKTRPEVLAWQKRLGLHTAFIVENGAAAYLPKTLISADELAEYSAANKGIAIADAEDFWQVAMSAPRAQIIDACHALRERGNYQFEGFSDFSVAQLCDITGLAPIDAEQAMAREFSEPICWQDTDARWQEFETEIAKRGLHALKGGRFTHIMGATDKGVAMLKLAALLCPEQSTITIALGDSHNDVAMLKAASYAVVIRSPSHPPPAVSDPQGEVMLSEEFGPAGWSSCMQYLLDKLESDSNIQN
ncbi:HAD-IIB family hydrolase [Spongiibacter sp. KMU-158]|uniref:HAD-IIB family hydrolase n=1 Tax=Spongiibacter pelagi TaxID=2760804 RepID=A0A927GWQ2_9GAMM|nr:HAD-IIB family hydrolase [Spongiibacter pelagi]MBD2859996.1 HAD-IIB family hydrolase [Spongiibacter pelagi]